MTYFKIGIDFGGEYLRIFTQESLILKDPSLVAVRKKGKLYFTIGTCAKAKELQQEKQENLLIFSPIMDGKILSVEYASLMLKHALNKVSHLFPKNQKLFAIVSVPSSLNIDEKELYVRTCKMAGINKIDIVSTPICTLLGTNAFNPEEEVIIADLGASKCDFQILKDYKIQKNATLGIGGNAIKSAISQMLWNSKKFYVEDENIAKTEIELASLFDNDKRSFQVEGYDTMNHTPSQIVLTSKDLYPITKGFFNEIYLILQTLIFEYEDTSNTHPAILISGGLGKISGLAHFLSTKFPDTKIVIETDADALLACGFQKILQ